VTYTQIAFFAIACAAAVDLYVVRTKILGPRLASAPLEDIAFGFALILGVLALWVFWGRRGIDRKK